MGPTSTLSLGQRPLPLAPCSSSGSLSLLRVCGPSTAPCVQPAGELTCPSLPPPELKKQVESAELKNQRLKEVFQTKIQEFRKVCYALTGYQIDITTESQYRLTSMYAEHKADSLIFKVGPPARALAWTVGPSALTGDRVSAGAARPQEGVVSGAEGRLPSLGHPQLHPAALDLLQEVPAAPHPLDPTPASSARQPPPVAALACAWRSRGSEVGASSIAAPTGA